MHLYADQCDSNNNDKIDGHTIIAVAYHNSNHKSSYILVYQRPNFHTDDLNLLYN